MRGAVAHARRVRVPRAGGELRDEVGTAFDEGLLQERGARAFALHGVRGLVEDEAGEALGPIGRQNRAEEGRHLVQRRGRVTRELLGADEHSASRNRAAGRELPYDEVDVGEARVRRERVQPGEPAPDRPGDDRRGVDRERVGAHGRVVARVPRHRGDEFLRRRVLGERRDGALERIAQRRTAFAAAGGVDRGARPPGRDEPRPHGAPVHQAHADPVAQPRRAGAQVHLLEDPHARRTVLARGKVVRAPEVRDVARDEAAV